MKVFILISVASLALLMSCTSMYKYSSIKKDKFKEQKIAHFNYIPEELAE